MTSFLSYARPPNCHIMQNSKNDRNYIIFLLDPYWPGLGCPIGTPDIPPWYEPTLPKPHWGLPGIWGCPQPPTVCFPYASHTWLSRQQILVSDGKDIVASTNYNLILRCRSFVQGGKSRNIKSPLKVLWTPFSGDFQKLSESYEKVIKKLSARALQPEGRTWG